VKKICGDVLSGKRNFWSGTGNAHTLTFNSNLAEIFNEYTEKSIQIELKDFLLYVDEWIEFVIQKNNKIDIPRKINKRQS